MRYIYTVNGQTSATTFPSRQAALVAAFLFAGHVKAVVGVRPA